jgi:hypothetical protein
MPTDPRTRRPNPSVRSVSDAGGLEVYEASSYKYWSMRPALVILVYAALSY